MCAVPHNTDLENVEVVTAATRYTIYSPSRFWPASSTNFSCSNACNTYPNSQQSANYRHRSLVEAAIQKYGGVLGLMRYRSQLSMFWEQQEILNALDNLEAEEEGDAGMDEEAERAQVVKRGFSPVLLPKSQALERW